MFNEGDKIYYIDINDGTILEGKFIEITGDGMWIRLKGLTFNTFVYSDSFDERVFRDSNSAETGLDSIKRKMKARLLKDNYFIKDIIDRLRKNEGELYLNIISEVLHEKAEQG